MLLQFEKKLDDLIVSLLAKEPGLSAKDIFEKLEQSGNAYSSQAIYKELKKLLVNDVIIKVKVRYSLKYSWIINFSELAHQTAQIYNEKIREELLQNPLRKKKLSWSFTNVHSADSLLGHLSLIISHNSIDPIAYIWTTHPWHPLINRQNRPYFLQALSSVKKQFCVLIRHKTFLGNLVAKDLPAEVYKIAYATETIPKLENSLAVIISPYTLTIEYSQKIANKIDSLFQNSGPDSTNISAEAARIFNLVSPVKITLRVDNEACRQNLIPFLKVFK